MCTSYNCHSYSTTFMNFNLRRKLHTNKTIILYLAPSPRQRCRIRTNPWVSNTDTLSSSNTSFPARKIENDSNSSSSGLKSSSDAGTDNRNGYKNTLIYLQKKNEFY